MMALQLFQFELGTFIGGVGCFLLEIDFVNMAFKSSISACEFSKLICTYKKICGLTDRDLGPIPP